MGKSKSPRVKSIKTPDGPKGTKGTKGTKETKETKGAKGDKALVKPERRLISPVSFKEILNNNFRLNALIRGGKALTPGTLEDREILRQILNIKIPEKFYSKPNMVLGDLVKSGNPALEKGIAKTIYNAAANLVFGENTVINTLIKILTLVLSSAIPYQKVKTEIISEMLKIIKLAKNGTAIAFTEIYLKLMNKKRSPLAIFRNFSFALVLPVIVGSFVIYSSSGNEEGVFKYVENAAKSFVSKKYTLFATETPEITGETNVFLVKENLIKQGENIIKLEKLGILSPEIPGLNPKGILIEYNPLSYNSKKPIHLKLIAKVPYLDNSDQYLVGDIAIIRSTQEMEELKEKLIGTTKFYSENLESISRWYSNVLEIVKLVIKYDTFIRDFSYTIQDLKASNDPKKELKIKIYEDLGEDILTKEGIRGKSLADKYSIPEKAIQKFLEVKKIRESLLFSGINTKIKDHTEKVLEAAGTPAFTKTVRDNLNIINNTRSKLIQASRDIKSAALKNINIVSLRVDGTTSVLSSVINKIKKYDTSNPVEFFKAPSPVSINIKELNTSNNPLFKVRAQTAKAAAEERLADRAAALDRARTNSITDF